MIALVHASPSTLDAYPRDHLGVLSSPRRFYTNVEGWRWAADNDAFSKWDADRYQTMLNAIAGIPDCLFVTAPDVVGDAAATTERYYEWLERIRACGQPIAYVTQDGLDEPPWDELAAVFIGGTTAWKMGDANRQIVNEAKRRGLWVHMGRVNSHMRVRYAKAIECDSFDGTSLSWFRDRWLPPFLEHAGAAPQGHLDF